MKLFHSVLERWLKPNSNDTDVVSFLKQLTWFGYLQGISCAFPVIIFLSLAFTTVFPLGFARYDILLLICILAQVIMYKSGMETADEVLVITLFHALGLCMELHKVNVGSWSYPESALTKIAGVPLYAGFMYASVGSYICQAWRNLKLTVVNWPKDIWAYCSGAAIYLNFFTNAIVPDVRIYISIGLIIIFWSTKFQFQLYEKVYRISALLSFIIIGLFIWLAENIATYWGAWKYAYQHAGWQMVSWHKISSWSLLVIVSIIIVGQLKLIKARRHVYVDKI